MSSRRFNNNSSANPNQLPRGEAANNGDLSCLIALLKSFAETNTEPESGQGFEHPIAFYDETDRASSSSCLTFRQQQQDEEDAARNKRRRRRGIIAAVALLLLVAIILAAVLGSKNKQEARTSAAKAAEWERHCGERRKQRALRTQRQQQQEQRELDTDTFPYHSIGCFRVQVSPDNRTVTAETFQDRVAACDKSCTTNYFGLAGLKTDRREFDDDEDTVTCYCYVDRPVARLSIGPCHRIDVLYDCGDDNGNESTESRRQEMEVFFDPHVREECSQDTTATVRNFLVEEDDVPFGFDVVTSEFRPSPFELYKDECGTNVYEVQTEVSQGSRKLTTTLDTIEEDVIQRRGDLEASMYGRSQSGLQGWFWGQGGRSVAGWGDRKQYNLFRSSGAQQDGSAVFTSFGVQRLAEIKIVDFENKRDFVTLSPEFGALLRSYRQDHARETARQIFRTYGMFVVTRGIFGGYVELRTTMLASDVSELFIDEEHARTCYESYVSTRERTFGFLGGMSYNPSMGADSCDAAAMDALEAARRAFELETGEADVVGGTAVDNELVVTPGTSTLLTSSDMYPLGDNGLELRPLTDFLTPQVISPLEIKRYQLDESDFTDIQASLRKHLREEMLELQDVVDEQCSECKVPYFVPLPDSWGFKCSCYKPSDTPFGFEDVTQSPTEHVFEPIAGKYRSEIRRRGEQYWGVGPYNQGSLEIFADGTFTYNNRQVRDFEYDPDRKFLSWEEQGNTVTRVDITFYTIKKDESFYGDQANSTVTTLAFMGVIDDGWFAADEIRGFLVEDE